METIELRQAIRTIYAEKSLNVSDCYKFNRIKKANCIYYQQEDKGSQALAKILQKHIEETYFQPVLLQAVTFNLTARNYYLGWKEALKFVSSLEDTQKTLVICNSIVARILLEFASIDEMSDKFNIPDYILDINEYKNDELTFWNKVPSNIATLKERKAIYLTKSYKLTKDVIVLLSSLDYIEILSETNNYMLERAILVNDCPNAPKWYIKKQTAKFNKALNKNFPKIVVKQYTQSEFKKQISNLNSAMMFVPQSKTWWKYYASPNVSFWIDAEDNPDIDNLGPMDFQAFCKDIANFAQTAPDLQASQNFFHLYKRKKFICLNKFIYWLRQ